MPSPVHSAGICYMCPVCMQICHVTHESHAHDDHACLCATPVAKLLCHHTHPCSPAKVVPRTQRCLRLHAVSVSSQRMLWQQLGCKHFRLDPN